MSPAEIIALITVPLLAVVGQLQRLIPLLRQDLATGQQTLAGVRTLLEHFKLEMPSSSSSSPSSPRSG